MFHSGGLKGGETFVSQGDNFGYLLKRAYGGAHPLRRLFLDMLNIRCRVLNTMNIGENIQLSSEEREALAFGDMVLPEAWPLTPDGFRELEHLLYERIIDKRGVMDELRKQKKLRTAPEVAFRLRHELAVLYDAHDQLFLFATHQGFDLPGPND